MTRIWYLTWDVHTVVSRHDNMYKAAREIVRRNCSFMQSRSARISPHPTGLITSLPTHLQADIISQTQEKRSTGMNEYYTGTAFITMKINFNLETKFIGLFIVRSNWQPRQYGNTTGKSVENRDWQRPWFDQNRFSTAPRLVTVRVQSNFAELHAKHTTLNGIAQCLFLA